MTLKRATLACASALILISCGGGTVEPRPEEVLDSTEQGILWSCEPNDAWVRRWYTNFSKTVETGREHCCNGVQWWVFGQGSNYYTQQGFTSCSQLPPWPPEG
jgi:hypothetical protein